MAQQTCGDASCLEAAKRVLSTNESVLFGVFSIVASSRVFPPLGILNEFFSRGSDACDQDGRMAPWPPFTVSPEEYSLLKSWWAARHVGTVETGLGVQGWGEWVQAVTDL